MAIREMVTKNDQLVVHDAAITSNTDTNTAIVDTAAFDMGISFYMFATTYTDGTYTLSFQEGDAANLSDASTVPAEKLVQSASISAATSAAGGSMAKVGLHSTARYVRAVITSTGVTSGATVTVAAQRFAETLPVE